MKINLKPVLAGIIFFLSLSLISIPLLSQTARPGRPEVTEKAQAQAREAKKPRFRNRAPFPSPDTKC